MHSHEQRSVIRDLLQQVEMADDLLVRETADGELVDGHLRRELFDRTELVPAVVVDLSDEEADFVTPTFDSSAAWRNETEHFAKR